VIFRFQQGATQLANLLVAAVLFVRLPYHKLKNPETGVSLRAIIFSISVAFSSLLNVGIDFFSNKYLPNFISFLNRVGFLFLITRYICTRDTFYLLIRTVVVLGSATAVYTIVDNFLHLTSTAEMKAGRAVGVYGDPNCMAANLAGLVPLAYYLFLHGTSKWLKRLNIFAIGSLVLALFLTVSRGGLLALTITGGWIAKKNLKEISTPIILGLILILFSSYAKDLYSKREIIKTSLSGKKSLEHSAVSRTTLIKHGFELWIKNPIFGDGFENTARSFKEQLNINTRLIIHNAYIAVLAEFGSVGFLLFMGLYLLAFKSLSHLSRHQDTYFSELAVYLRLALLSHMITSCFIGNWMELMLWCTIALPIILDQISKNEQNTARQG
jgi:O-antigen ligase